jgi:hypothetical protein
MIDADDSRVPGFATPRVAFRGMPLRGRRTRLPDGKVIDVTGGPLPAAKVVIRSGDAIRQESADGKGIFRIGDLAKGIYTLKVSLQGFQDKTIPEVVVGPGVSADLGTIVLRFGRCNTPDGPICDELPDQAEPIPTLTVCEALRNLDRYNGKEVVLAGLSAYTFEGTFLSEHCEPDGRVIIQGHRWLSMIAVGTDAHDSGGYPTFKFDDELVRTKLRESQQSTHLEKSQTGGGMFGPRMVAMHGRLVSPPRLTPFHPPAHPGDGFGANGSVPARIIVDETEDLSGRP